MRTIVVSGAVANKPHNAGETWVRLSWILGLRRLGFRVVFLEQIDQETCIGSDGDRVEIEESVNLAYFQEVLKTFGLEGSASLIHAGGKQFFGLEESEILDIAAESELLVNITGHLVYQPVFRRFRRKAYVDVDPGFTQFWHGNGQSGARLEAHDHYFTVGGNIGRPGCSIPTGNIHWRAIRPPVVLDSWPVSTAGVPERLTTIASWRGTYGRVEHGGKRFGLKLDEFRRMIDLPRRAPQRFELALDIHPGDRQDLARLEDHGWVVIEPRQVAGDPIAYRRYIQESGGEFSVAQGIYVETNSGWFSDRTAQYLACGKPTLVQETGFSLDMPAGRGLIAFRTLKEAIDGAESIAANYDEHRRGARQLAEDFFDSDVVLCGFIEDVGISL